MNAPIVNSVFIFFVILCKLTVVIAVEHIFEGSVEICIEWVKPVRLCRKVAPMFIHPEPGRWVLSYVRFKRIPTCLRDLLMSHPDCVADLGMKDKPVAPFGSGSQCAGMMGTPVRSLNQACAEVTHVFNPKQSIATAP